MVSLVRLVERVTRGRERVRNRQNNPAAHVAGSPNSAGKRKPATKASKKYGAK